MTGSLPLLLRLPPCLRQQLLSRESLVRQVLQERTSNINGLFRSQTRLASGNPSPPKPRILRPKKASSAVPKPSVPSKPPPRASTPPPQPRNSSGAAPPTSPTAPIPVPPPQPQAALPPRPIAYPSAFDDGFLRKYGQNRSNILLYVAPSHRAFKILSLLLGTGFLLGTYSYAQLFLKDEPEAGGQKPWYVQLSGGVVVFFMAVLSTTIIIAPTKLIKSVSLVRMAPPSGQNVLSPRMLRIEVKRYMPFLKPDIVEVNTGDVAIDRAVRASSGDIGMINISPELSEEFTESYASTGLKSVFSPGEGIRGALSRFNKRLLNIWPGFKRETARMTIRENMAYLDIKNNGKFKMDLRDCMVLDKGQPLAQLFREDPNARGTIWTRATALFKG